MAYEPCWHNGKDKVNGRRRSEFRDPRLSELQAKLSDLGDKAADRAIRAALRAGAEIEQVAISERAPIKDRTGGTLPDGALKNDIVIRIKKDQFGGLSATIGPDKLTKHVAGWVEYGASSRARR